MTLWLLVVGVGAYHGASPGMGWPLAVSNGLFKRSGRAVLVAMAPLAAGHFLAMAVVLLPFALLAAYLDWSRAIRLGAGLAVVAFGILRFVDTRHRRLLVRVRPTQLGLWSFLMATAHGAGLMLVPVYLGLCARPPRGGLHAALMPTSLGAALASPRSTRRRRSSSVPPSPGPSTVGSASVRSARPGSISIASGRRASSSAAPSAAPPLLQPEVAARST